MRNTHEVEIRRAIAADAVGIAALHADSWRRNYRGAYSDSFLDGDVVADRTRVWTQRLEGPGASTSTLVAESEGRLAGFAHVEFDSHPEWGSLLDNLHVAHDLKRTGIGSRLMATLAAEVLDGTPTSNLYLYVLEQNLNAQAFYRARGGRCVESSPVSAPGGIPSRLNGTPMRLLYVWEDASALLAGV